MAARKIAKKLPVLRKAPPRGVPLINGGFKSMDLPTNEAPPSYSTIFAARTPCNQCLSPDINKCACPAPVKPLAEEDLGKAVVAKMGSQNAVRCTFCEEWFDPNKGEAGHVGRWSATCADCFRKLKGHNQHVSENDYY